jgi:hypothetical protein
MLFDRVLGLINLLLAFIAIGIGVLAMYLSVRTLPEYTQNDRFCFLHAGLATCTFTMYECQVAEHHFGSSTKITQSCKSDKATAHCYPGPAGKMIPYTPPPQPYIEESFIACPTAANS